MGSPITSKLFHGEGTHKKSAQLKYAQNQACEIDQLRSKCKNHKRRKKIDEAAQGFGKIEKCNRHERGSKKGTKLSSQSEKKRDRGGGWVKIRKLG